MRTMFFLASAFTLAISAAALSDETQIMTVSELVAKCSTPDPTSAAFCLGLATGIVNGLSANGIGFMDRDGNDETRNFLKDAGAACGLIEPKQALITFIDWAKIHPEKSVFNGLYFFLLPFNRRGHAKII
jgi:hypothetical protein